ncbi:hypothetical protein B9Z65_1215 [Elsinoe australis]|uniref:Uncharacterized protein n=1 Tax=Elsinoe australis TaxID=40998 RepID=A0A2P7YPY3_9PEZI|nr:hypothetical protein B9Z65_1215 [Elsinoe australis]
MRIISLLAGLYAAVAVYANQNAAPYELMWYYDAYKIQWRGGGPKTIATGFTHTLGTNTKFEDAAKDQGLDGICTFDEFVRHIAGNHYTGFKTSADPLKQLDPDEKEVTAEIQRLEAVAKSITGIRPVDTQWRVNIANLLPGNAVSAHGPSSPLAPALDELDKAVDNARALKVGDSRINTLSEDGVKCLNIAQQFRQAKFGTELRGNLKDLLGPKGVKTLTMVSNDMLYKDGTMNKKSAFQTVDWDATLKVSGVTATKANVRDALASIAAGTTGLKKDGGKTHLANIFSMQSTVTHLGGL